MKLALTIADYTWSGNPQHLAPTLRAVAQAAEAAGFTQLAVMDHLWQIGVVGSAEQEMLEAYTTLGYLAGATTEVDLLTLVTSAVYREPGLLAKMVTTLDVLSGGRARLGIGTGAPLNQPEADGLGLPFPRLGERFERLEETLQICRQMWSGEDKPFHGKHYQLGRTLNGGSGPRTLRLVAEYADACNLFPTPDLARRLDVLRAHCDAIGRDYDEIEKTVLYPLDPGKRGRNIDALLRQLQRFADLGIDLVYGPVPAANELTPLQLLGAHVIPAAAHLSPTRNPS
jgi:F420-dependent oxidoreductase-like protein